MSDIYVFDLDGVIVDPSERIKAVLSRLGLPLDIDVEKLKGSMKRRFWDLFLSPKMLHLDKPRDIGIEVLKDRMKRGKVIIVTGRPISLKKPTIRELMEFGVEIDYKNDIIFRPKGDLRPDYEYKASIISMLDNVVEIHDDSIRVLEAIRKVRPHVMLYLHYGNSYTILG